MFKPNTVFIVGAGASAELGMPFGNEFKVGLSERIQIRFDDWGRTQESGDPVIMQALETIAEQRRNFNVTNELLNAAWDISNALPNVSSIDSYVEMHKGNKDITFISKLGIIRTILDAERSSELYFEPHNKKGASLRSFSNTWLAKFVQLLTNRVEKSGIESIFENISIICFNYDRCIEQYLALALEHIYLIKEQEAQDLVKKLKIYHPYGTVGGLPWSKGNQFDITFGKEINAHQLLKLTAEIKTYSEQTDEKETLNAIKEEVRNAKTLVFLGMAYHKQNLDLLKPNENTNIRKIYGTSVGISESNQDIYKRELHTFLDNAWRQVPQTYLKSLKCSEFLDEFSGSLSER